MGQKFRFQLAYALTRKTKKILIDEYSVFLDRETAKIISYMLQKLVRNGNKQLVLITANNDLKEYLQPDVLIEFDDYSNLKISKNKTSKFYNPFSEKLIVKKGNYNDLKRLEKYHYFGDVSEVTLSRRDAEYYSLYFQDKLMGILVTALPYANTVTENELITINNSLRLIFRIIIHPKVRGVGATKILFNEMKSIEKKFFFVRSAMAIEHPFLEKMGMVQKKYIDYEANTDYKRLKKLNEDNESKEKLYTISTNILGITMWKEYKEYAKLVDLQTSFTQDYFIKIVRKTFNQKKIYL